MTTITTCLKWARVTDIPALYRLGHWRLAATTHSWSGNPSRLLYLQDYTLRMSLWWPWAFDVLSHCKSAHRSHWCLTLWTAHRMCETGNENRGWVFPQDHATAGQRFHCPWEAVVLTLPNPHLMDQVTHKQSYSVMNERGAYCRCEFHGTGLLIWGVRVEGSPKLEAWHSNPVDIIIAYNIFNICVHHKARDCRSSHNKRVTRLWLLKMKDAAMIGFW